MAYTAPHNVLQVLGDITTEGEVEQWSFGLRFGEGNRLMGQNLVGPDDPSPTAVLEAIRLDLQTWWNQVRVHIPGAVRWTGFKFNAVDVLGRQVNQTKTWRYDYEIPPFGNATGLLPPQLSVAATFRTAAARGLASTGRIYLPPFAQTQVDAGGRFSAGESVATGVAQLLTNLSNWSGVDNLNDYGKVCVMSKVGAGATRRVNAVDVGDLFDTMRSRRRQLRENRSPRQTVSS